MSHFLLAVIVPKEIPNEQLKEHLEERMSPFDERLRVPKYTTKCYCVGLEAKTAAEEEANEAEGSIASLARELFSDPKMVRARDIMMGFEERTPEDLTEEEYELRLKHQYMEHDKVKTSALNAHPLKDSPDPKCDNCKGTGEYKTNYNPKSKWDWYRIGGRFDGCISGIEVTSADKGFNFSDIHELPQNNRCDITEYFNRQIEGPGCFAILTPEEWLDSDAGWFKRSKEWEVKGLAILEKYINQPYDVVGVDCHI